VARRAALGLCLLFLPACSQQDVLQPSSPTLEIIVATLGEEPDSDGYTVQVDALPARQAAAQVPQVSRVPLGQHTIYVGAVADNCLVQGANPRTISVPSEGASVVIEVICKARTGNVQVSLRVQGALPYPREQTVALDDIERARIDTGRVLISGVVPGSHQVRLRGVPENCSVGGNPRGVTVLPVQTQGVEFLLRCSALHGILEISITQRGEWNSEGYSFSIDEGRAYSLAGPGSLGLPYVPSGLHQVELINLPANCSVQGDNPARVQVPAGGRQTLRFDVFCR
jgi:hypothetical protein